MNTNKKSNSKLTIKVRILFTVIVTLLIWSHLTWDYFNGGVPKHHILNREDFPAISNWWGGITLPIFTWILLYRIKQRVDTYNSYDSLHSIFYGFIGMLLFGISLSYFFSIGSEIPGYMMIGLFVLSFMIPVYRSEYFLGFVISTAYMFGAILPMGMGIILWTIYAITYKFIRRSFLSIVSRIGKRIKKNT
ncbi:hypothetical protein AB832_06260 [Flavobacteriaceae bacterium (ex Bugula neritina AB1)]|nr:hypothetical protein AB832_06260 [Flavobacteriaceae bacterium (ex Bugula neritina AB1)]